MALIPTLSAQDMIGVTFNAPPAAAGKTVQAVDVANCMKSNPLIS